MFLFSKKVSSVSLTILSGLVTALVLIVIPLQFGVKESGFDVLVSHAGIFDLDMDSFIDDSIAKILGIFLGLAGGILATVGWGFDQIMFHTIVNFSETFKIFEPGVNAAWGGFRDVANIIMIAMFVFVAFAVILNIQTYGLKQFGVRILVVAVLINFSLFFTKAIIDISNITAIQFEKAIQVRDADGNSKGITTIFTQKAGIVGGAYDGAVEALTKVQNENGFGTTLLYTIVTMVFFFALTIVMLYGLILMVTRVVMFIVLMLTSSAAFAAYMIPGGNKWWDKWWSHLIQNALFAPAFMMMLWGTVQIIDGVDPNGGSANFADLVGGDGGSWLYVLNMMIVIGLLYASTQVANNLSIGGAKFAGNMGKSGFRKLLSGSLRASGLGLALGLAGRAGRGTIGRKATDIHESDTLRRNAMSNNPLRSIPSRLALSASKKAAETSFDLRDSKAIAQNLKKAGIGVGTGVGNYDKMLDAEAKYKDDARKAGLVDVTETPQQPSAPVPNAEPEKKPEQAENNSGGTESHNTAINTQNIPSNDNRKTDVTSEASDAADSRGKQNEIDGAGEAIGRTAQSINEQQKKGDPLRSVSINNVESANSDQATVDELRSPSVPASNNKSTDGALKRLIKRTTNKPFTRTQKTQERIDKRARKLAGKTDEQTMIEQILKNQTDATEEASSTFKESDTK